MFTAKWKKEAKHLYKGAKKFIHYKRDLLAQDRIEEIESRRADLKSALKSGDKDATIEAGKQLQATCEQSLPRQSKVDSLGENVEVLFVALVVALGLRAYYLQPFRIPTGSMRPTLNGIIGHVEDKANWPAAPVRWAQIATHGRSYLSVVNEKEGDRIVGIQQKVHTNIFSKLINHFSTHTVITFASGQEQTVSGSPTAVLEVLNKQAFEALVEEKSQGRVKLTLSSNPNEILAALSRIPLPKGFKVAEGFIETGDLVLVDKLSYHFRKPEAGEVFVFDTRKISKIHEDARRTNTVAGSHYIKRLLATPGQKIELVGGKESFENDKYGRKHPGQMLSDNALVYVDGEKMKAPGVLRVESLENGFGGYLATERLAPGLSVTLRDKPSSGKSEYWAQGDNSYNSSDSRMFGTVKEFNLVGPAAFTLWPFGSGHWGFID